jgi:hypothetical protein
VRGRVTLPLTGAWVADVVCEPVNDQGAMFPNPGSTVTVTIGSQGFNGVVRRASNPFGTVFARLIGGAGGLPTVLEPKGYSQTTVQAVVTDLLSDCGETLSSMSDTSMLSQQLNSWVRLGVPGWQALSALVQATDGTWRVLPDGTIWLGVDAWPNTSLENFELLGYEPQELRADIYAENPTLLPGQAFLGGHVASVDHVIEPDKLMSRVLFLDAQLAKVENG